MLTNGARIIGEVVALADGKLALRTDYAGDIVVRWSEVASIATTRPIGLLLADQRTFARGMLEALTPGRGWGVKATYAPWFHEHEGFWNLENTEALLVRSKTGLRFPLVERLSASAQLDVDLERVPAPGRRSTDSTLLFGVNYGW